MSATVRVKTNTGLRVAVPVAEVEAVLEAGPAYRKLAAEVAELERRLADLTAQRDAEYARITSEGDPRYDYHVHAAKCALVWQGAHAIAATDRNKVRTNGRPSGR